MKIEIWLDLVCPYCYIGKRQLEISLDNFPFRRNVFIQFKSYQRYSGKTDKSLTNQTCIEEDYLHKQAADVGLTINQQLQPANTFDAHRLIKYANQLDKGMMLTERLLTAYFNESKSIEDPTVLVKLAEEVGLPRAEVQAILETRKFTNAVSEDIDLANEMDVQVTPFFVFNEKYSISGMQPSYVFQEVLETVWQEDDTYNKQRHLQRKKTSYCDGDGHCEEDDKIE